MNDVPTAPGPEAEGSDDGSMSEGTPSQETRMLVGSFEQVTDDLNIRYAEEESFDVESILAKADAVVPGSVAVADAVNQYGYALVRFPEGKSWNDLMPRKTPGYEGWSHFATYGENGGVGGGNAAIRQAGLQPAAVANLAMQGAAMALGLAYMARIDSKLSDISKGIDEILLYMEEDYVSRLEGHAVALAEYREFYEEYANSVEERTSAITNTERIFEKLRGYWRKELRRMERLQTEVRSQGKTVKEADARRMLEMFIGIDNRMRYIFGLAIISREILMQYGANFSHSRISRERRTVFSMRDEYVSSRDSAVRRFNEMAKRIKAPITKSIPRAFVEQAEPKLDLLPVKYGAWLGGLLGAGIGATIGAAGLAVRVGAGVGNVNSERQQKYLRDVSRIASYIEDTAQAYGRELDNLEFRFNEANALLIGPESITPLVVVDARDHSPMPMEGVEEGGPEQCHQ